MPWLTWSRVDEHDALPVSEWNLISGWGATYADDVDPYLYEGFYTGLRGTRRLWSAYRSAGLEFKTVTEMPEALGLIDKAAQRAREAGVVLKIFAADLDPTSARPLDGAANAFGLAGRTSAEPNAWHELMRVLTFGDLKQPGGGPRVILTLGYAAGKRILAEHRAAGADFDMLWRALLTTVHAPGTANALAGVMGEELGITVANALRAAVVPKMFHIASPRLAVRRMEICANVRSRGVVSPTAVKERLRGATASGELPRLATIVANEPDPSRLSAHVADLAALLDVSGELSEASLRAIERALVHKKVSPEGATPTDRITSLEAKLAMRTDAINVAPRAHGGGGGGGDELGGGGGVTEVMSHSRMQQAHLFDLYETPNFREQEAAIARMDTVGALYLALTARFFGAVGAANGPADKAEAQAAARWTVVPIFHQLVWGKVQVLHGKEELRKLARARVYMPELLGKLAARRMTGADQAGVERLASLKLESLFEQLKAPEWRGKLDIANGLLVPLLAAYHDADLDKQPRVTGLARYDPAVLRLVAPALAEVLRVCAVPLNGPHSVASWLAPVHQIWALHGPAATAAQRDVIAKAVETYVEQSLHDYAISFNAARFEADALAVIDAKLGHDALAGLQQTLRSLNGTASRKRTAEGGDGDGVIVLPKTTYGDVTSGRPGGAAMSFRPPTPPRGATVGPDGVAPGHWKTSSGFVYDEAACKTWLSTRRCGELCVRGVLLNNNEKLSEKLRNHLISVGCPHQKSGSGGGPARGHDGVDGAAHKVPEGMPAFLICGPPKRA